jgi:hypothetical protein
MQFKILSSDIYTLKMYSLIIVYKNSTYIQKCTTWLQRSKLDYYIQEQLLAYKQHQGVTRYHEFYDFSMLSPANCDQNTIQHWK